MFKKFLAYYRYQRSVKEWAKTVDYSEHDIDWVFPWTDIKAIKTHRNIVVVFDRDFTIKNYTCIYKTQKLIILEKTPSDKRKVRFGIPPELHQELLKFVRLVAMAHLCSQSLPEIKTVVREEFHPYLDDSYTVDVGVWVDGIMRGSRLSNTNATSEAITVATLRCIHDERLKPVTQAELSRSIFEVTLIPNIWIVFQESNLDQIAPFTMATRCMQSGIEQGCYIPMVANTNKFNNLREYLDSLLRKAQLTPSKEFLLQTAPTFSAAENGQGNVITFHGPYPKHVSTSVNERSLSLLKDNILKNIDDDGFVQVVKSVENYSRMILDVSRTGFIFYSLAEHYGITKDASVYQALTSLKRGIDRVLTGYHSEGKIGMLKVYLNQASIYLPESKVYSITQNETYWVKRSPLGATQFLKQRVTNPETTASEAQSCLLEIKALFQQWQATPREFKCPIQYSDLLWLLTYSGLSQEANELADWLRAIQQNDGSFLAAGIQNKAYTRGTGKVAEATAGVPGTQDIAEKALTYLRQMQYNDTTMYHIPLWLRDEFRGGFRHDVWNRDLWLDGSAHVLLAELRLLYASAYRDHLQTCLSAYTSVLPKLDS